MSSMEFGSFVNLLHPWLSYLAALVGAIAILVPILGFRRFDQQLRGISSGGLAGLQRWPYMMVMSVLFVTAGVLLWIPLPILLTPPWQAAALIVGALLYFPAIALYLWGYKTLGEHFGLSSGFGAALYSNHQLIQTGPFQYVRHPMYLAVILAAIGALLIFRTWAMLIFAPLSSGIIFRAQREDALLAQAFGEDWQAYRNRVPAWIPNPSKIGMHRSPNQKD